MLDGRETPCNCIYILILLCFYQQGTNSTTCTDIASLDGFTNVLSMCRNGTLTARRVVVDTYDTGVLDRGSCQCTVSLTGANTGPVELEVVDYPGTAPTFGCGSVLRFTRHPTNTYTEYQCTQIISDSVTNFANNELLDITLSKVNNNIQWQSGYCILLKTVVNITVTCEIGSGFTSASTTTTTTTPETTTTTTTTTTPETTTTPTTTSITIPSSSSVQTVTNSTDSGGDVTGGHGGVEDKSIGIGVIAGAAGGGAVLVIILIIVVTVIVLRKKSSDRKETEDNFTVDIQPYAVTTPKFYQNEVDDTLTENPLYQSAGPRDPDTNHIVTETGDEYALVQKPNKHTHSEIDHSNSTEQSHTSSPSGDVYAVINKSKKEPNDDNNELQKDENTHPYRYKTPDGLVYATVDDTTSQLPARPPVRPKPTPNADRVIYSEVETGD